MPWVALEHSDGRAVYVANHDPEVAFTTFLAEFDAELRIDGNTQAAFGSAAPQRWPLNSGADSTLTLLWAMFPFLEPGERFQGPPVVVRSCQRGDGARPWSTSNRVSMLVPPPSSLATRGWASRTRGLGSR